MTSGYIDLPPWEEYEDAWRAVVVAVENHYDACQTFAECNPLVGLAARLMDVVAQENARREREMV